MQQIGVIGAGSFGTAIADLISDNAEVLLYSRQTKIVQQINETHQHFGIQLSENVRATDDLEEMAKRCQLLFGIVPSVNFREMIRSLSPYLRPYHILIHGTKGFDTVDIDLYNPDLKTISRRQVYSMSEVILQESSVLRVGCLSGPNLASEILAGQPTATVVASRFREVIKIAEKVLNSRRFHVFGSYDLLGAELAGALKNGIAIGAGILHGMGMGKNIQALLITRGLNEMIHFGKGLGAESSAFLGTAGIGDLVATASSQDSRNFIFGKRLGQGETMEDILKTMPELAEGVRTLKIMKLLADAQKIRVPITQMLYSIIYEGFEKEKALNYLMKYPYGVDVDFL